MAIFIIGDLHLSFYEKKPMSIFGDNWDKHEEKIKKDWEEKVNQDDLVVLPGDFSWSTYLKDTYEDFKYLNNLPGKKLLLKGNHDYWWTTITNMKNYLKENNFNNIDFLHNNAYEYENKVFAGTRGWTQTENSEDIKLVQREAQRLELSIIDGIKKWGTEKEIIALMHFPPITQNNIWQNKENSFIKIMNKYKIQKCYYGHLHGGSIKEAIEGNHFGIEFKLVSCDGLNFKLLKI